MVHTIIPSDDIGDQFISCRIALHGISPVINNTRNGRSAIRMTHVRECSIIKTEILQEFQSILGDIAGLHQIAAEEVATRRCDLQSSNGEKAYGKEDEADQNFNECKSFLIQSLFFQWQE